MCVCVYHGAYICNVDRLVYYLHYYHGVSSCACVVLCIQHRHKKRKKNVREIREEEEEEIIYPKRCTALEEKKECGDRFN